eukprot:gene13809-4041_t
MRLFRPRNRFSVTGAIGSSCSRSYGLQPPPEFRYQDMFPQGADDTPYRKISSDHVSTIEAAGREILKVEPEALTLLTKDAMHDIAHLLRPGHLQQLRNILDDPEATEND